MRASGDQLIPSIWPRTQVRPIALHGACVLSFMDGGTGNDFIWVLGHFSLAVTSRLATSTMTKRN